MTLAERLNKIIREQNLSKAEFARRVGISENYIYILTGSRGNDADNAMPISASPAKLIALEFGYDEDWVMRGAEMQKNNQP